MSQHHRQEFASQAIVVLDGLIGIGIGPQYDGLRLIGWLGKLPSQQLGSIGFGKQLALEIQPGGELKVGVAGSGITVDAAMLGYTFHRTGLIKK